MRKKTLAACLLLTVATLANALQSAAEWVRYDSAEGRYSVLLPKLPTLASQEGTTPTGDKLTQYRAGASDPDSLYSVGYFDLLPNTTYSLDNGRDGMVKAIDGTLLGEEAISLGGHPGRQLKLSFKKSDYEGLVQARLYEIGGRVYILQHAFLKSSDTPSQAQKTNKFFDSFKVTTGK
jgi:hypothetical protein